MYTCVPREHCHFSRLTVIDRTLFVIFICLYSISTCEIFVILFKCGNNRYLILRKVFKKLQLNFAQIDLKG